MKSKMSIAKSKPIGEGAFNLCYSRYIDKARERNIFFELTKDEFRELTSGNCYYCGIEPFRIAKYKNCNGTYTFNGVDRVDNSKGYIYDNCVPCCYECNVKKGEVSMEIARKMIAFS